MFKGALQTAIPPSQQPGAAIRAAYDIKQPLEFKTSKT